MRKHVETSELLGRVRVAAPCPANWAAMEGDDRARFCRQCSLHVYNLSAMTRAEAEALVARTEGRLCGRFYRRADGTILTRDCPTGLRALRRRVRRRAAAVFAMLAGLWASAAGQTPAPRVGPEKPAAVACEGEGQLKIKRRPTAAGEPARIAGIVYDPNGAAVPGAVATLTNELTKEEARATTDDTGAFSFAPSLPGTYTLRVEAVGFKTQEATGLNVAPGESLSVESFVSINVDREFVGIILIDLPTARGRNGHGVTVFDGDLIRKLPIP